MSSPSQLKTARAVAHSNIALVKYWGKRADADPVLNLPAVGSLSLTLGSLRTETVVGPGERDCFVLDGEAATGGPASKVFRHLDLMWNASRCEGPRPACDVQSTNHLPTAAGLASSASGFAALTIAAGGCFGLVSTLDSATRTVLSGLARQGSGSAARSLWGGFVRLDRGERVDGSDCVAHPLHGPEHWDLRLLIAHTARGPKAVGSTGGMERSRTTSPYYDAWVATSEEDLDAGQTALAARDLEALGEVMEHSCFKMHACMFATKPPLVYWQGSTLEVIHEVWRARREGLVGYVTSDAGPHVKILTAAADAQALRDRIAEVPGVHEVESVAPGPDASLEIQP